MEEKSISRNISKISMEIFIILLKTRKTLNILEETNSGINFSHIYDVEKVTPDIIKEAVKHLKDGKSDPVHIFSSDCIKNAPYKLFTLFSTVFKCFLIHGHVTVYLLLATLVPIIKNKLSSINVSKNYRSIAISSLMLKILDWVILTLFGRTLGLDDLQYAYQPAASTTMCTWAVVETIGYFLRNGAEVFT